MNDEWVVTVASPCPAKWEQMAGDERVRFCRQCARHVYSLSDLSRAEVAKLLTKYEGQRVCARFYSRPDGTLITRDCPVGLAQKARRKVLRAVGSAAALLLALSSEWLGGLGADTLARFRDALSYVPRPPGPQPIPGLPAPLSKPDPGVLDRPPVQGREVSLSQGRIVRKAYLGLGIIRGVTVSAPNGAK